MFGSKILGTHNFSVGDDSAPAWGGLRTHFHPRGPEMKQYIESLKDKDSVQTTFLVQNKSLLTDKKGKSYLSFDLTDKTGAIDAKIWDNVEQWNNSFNSGDIVTVKGVVKTYQNRKQLVVHRISALSGEVEDFSDYLGETEKTPAENFAQILKICEKVQSDKIKELILSTLNDPTIKEKILVAPAAKVVHHAKKGGLIEHIRSICEVMVGIGTHYKKLNLDFLIFGGIFHDIGKIWELEWTPKGIHYTDAGRLVGHLVMASELVERKSRQILGFPEELITVLKHIVLSHHGRLDYGSPKVPMLPEAWVVWMIDDLDSKVDSLMGIVQSSRNKGEAWTSYSQLYQRHFFTKDFSESTTAPAGESTAFNVKGPATSTSGDLATSGAEHPGATVTGDKVGENESSDKVPHA